MNNYHEETIISGFLRQVNEKPEACAIRVREKCVSYEELYHRSKRLADWLCKQQLGGQRIGIKLENGDAYLVCFYGIVLAGSIAVPLPGDLPTDQMVDWCEHLGIGTVLEEVPTDIAEYKKGNQPKSSGHAQLLVLDPDGLFYMAVSSGSTGKPKGILRSHRSWVESFCRMKEAFGTGGKDRLLLPGKLHYSATLIAALQVLHEGGEVLLAPHYHSAEIRELLITGNVTACFMVPSMYAKLLSTERLEAEQTLTAASITFVSAGDKLSTVTATMWLRSFPNSRLYEYYGAAEISFVSYLHHLPMQATGDSVGRSFPGVELTIRDGQGQLVSTGMIGEVYVNSSMVAQAYGHRQAPPFLQSKAGGYTVGDLGYLDEAGFLHLVGRKQEVIVRGGVNLYPAEIERTLMADAAIGDAAVFGVADELLGERIIAAIILVGHSEQEEDVAKRLQNRFSRARRPDEYWIVPELPRNAAGKTDKKRLRELFFSR